MTIKIEVPCSGCSTDPCYHWPYCTELLSLRAAYQKQVEHNRFAANKHSEHIHELGDRLDELRAENERLNVYAHKIEEEARQSTFENERLRYALELIADCDCPDCEDAAAVAREALARDRR